MKFDPSLLELLGTPKPRVMDSAAINASANNGGIAAQMQSDPKKLGKEKKPDENLVSLVFPGT